MTSTVAAAADAFTIRGSVWIDGLAADRSTVTLRRYTTSLERRRAELGLEALPGPFASTRPREGEFEFTVPSVPIANWHLEISHSSGDFVPLRINLVPLDGDLLLPGIQLQRGHEVTAEVTDPDGTPVEGALVLFDALATPLDAVAQRRFPIGVRTPRQVRRTNAQGEARVRMPIGERAVRAAHPRYLMDEEQSEAVWFGLELSAGTPVDLELQRPNGRPAVGAIARMGQYSVPIAVADDRGRITLIAHDRAEVSYQVESAQNEMASVSLAPRSVDAPPVARRATRLETLRGVTGRAINGATGQPLADALVFTRWRPGDAVLTDGRGVFELPILDFRSQSQLIVHHADFVRTTWPVREGGDEIGDLLMMPAQTVAVQTLQADGNILSGARVEISVRTQQGWLRRNALTDGQGRASLSGLPRVGQATLRASAIGLAVAEMPLQLEALLSRRDPSEPIEVTVRRGLLLTGTVVDDQERPLSGAMVLFHPTRDTSMSEARALRQPGQNPEVIERNTRRVRLRDETGVDGRFFVLDAPPGTYEISVLAPGFTPLGVPGVEIREADAVDQLDGEPSAPNVQVGTLVLEPSATIAGVVVDPDGQPVEGAEVRYSRDQLRVAHADNPAASNGRGEFLLPGAETGQRYALEARVPGFGPAVLQEIEAPADDVTLELTPGADLLVRVRDAQGPVRRATVFASGAGLFGGSRTSDRSRSDVENGSYLLEALGPGRWGVMIYGEQPEQWEGEVEVEARDPRDGPQILEIELESGRAITVRLVDRQGVPVAGQVHFDVSRGNSSTGRSGKIRPNGDFEASVPTDALVEITATSPLHQVASRQLQPGDDDVDLTIELEDALELEGTVLAPDGEPAAGAMLLWTPTADGWTGSRLPQTIAGEDGRFTMNGLPADLGLLIAVDEEGRRGQLELDLRNGVPAGVTIELSEGLLIRGVVLGLNETELSGTRISAYATAGMGAERFMDNEARPDFGGEWNLRLPGPGEWSVEARTQNGRRRVETVVPGSGPTPVLTFDFTERNTLVLEVRRNGAPVQGATAFLSTGMAVSDQEGRMTLRDLPEGEQEIRVRLPSGASRSVRINVPAETSVPVDFAVRTLRGQVVDATTGLPVAAARLSALLARGDMLVVSADAQADAEGRFEIEVTVDDSAELIYSAYAEGYESRSGTFVDGMRIELQRQGVAVLLQLPDATQFARLLVHDGSRWTQTGAQRDRATGLLEVTGLPAGSWRGWLLAAGGSAAVQFQVHPPGTDAQPPLQVALSDYATVVVRSSSVERSNVHTAILVPPGADPGYEAEDLRVLAQRAVAAAPFTQAGDRAGSSATVTNVPVGSWSLRIVGGDREPAVAVTVGAGQTTVVDVP